MTNLMVKLFSSYKLLYLLLYIALFNGLYYLEIFKKKVNRTRGVYYRSYIVSSTYHFVAHGIGVVILLLIQIFSKKIFEGYTFFIAIGVFTVIIGILASLQYYLMSKLYVDKDKIYILTLQYVLITAPYYIFV